uniref:Reverse transcriptase domain-containing protein n=1 Tax=Leptobrachium leishanense TaxID=445787 RepID=A0A8C5QP47_9ANUR
MAPVNILSLNVKGLNSPRKRHLLFRELKRKSVDIALLQEIRIPKTAAFRLSDPAYSRVFLLCATPKRNGVVVLIQTSCLITITDSHTDDIGRCVLVSGTVSGQKYTFASVYGPNTPDADFWSSTHSFISSHATGHVVLGGDFNATLCPPIDRSTSHNDQTSHIPSLQDKQFYNFVHHAGYIDVWRVQHPSVKDYTYFSPVHYTYSRIDCILTSASCLPLVISSSIGSITWSDHADVSLQLRPFAPAAGRRWRLDPFLLDKPGVRDSVRETLQDYFRLNDIDDISMQVLWAAHKLVIRGALLGLASHLKKQKLADIQDLQRQLREREMTHKTSPSPETYAALSQVRQDLNRLFLDDVGRSLLWSKRRYYERSNKMDTPLARLLNPRPHSQNMPPIRDSMGSQLSTPNTIRDTFTQYFASIYNHTPTHSASDSSLMDDIKDYLSRASLPSLSDEQAATLASPITETELGNALSLMKPHKAPGPDGFTYQYYKAFPKILFPYLLRMFNDLMEGGTPPRESLLASIVLIPKPDKDHHLTENYRPISLINTDLKLLAKILSLRLEPFLTLLIHPDQVGFIPTRQAYENTRRAVDLVWTAMETQQPSLFLSLDAEKAFDRAEWPFLFSLLQHIRLPESFLAAINALYTSPSAQILLPGAEPIPFMISNGTRQGCPLSPALFALYLEPLLQHIRMNPGIQGLTVRSESFKVPAYADDILLSLSHPLESLPQLFKTLDEYARLSGYKININKSEAFTVH